MNKDEYTELLKTGLEHDGLQFCLDALQEECAELIQAISHHRRGRCGQVHVIREMADVVLMVDMVKLGMTGDPHFEHYIKRKAEDIGFFIKWKENNGDAKR